MELIAFIILSVLALVSACVVVFHRSPVISALALVINLVSVAGFYLLLNAQFLALLQVIVYAGAIMVLVLFVVMLLNLQDEERVKGSGFFQKWIGLVLAVGFAWIVGRSYLGSTDGRAFPDPSPDFGTVSALGRDLFTRYFYAFEVISLLLVVAMIGAVMLAKRRL